MEQKHYLLYGHGGSYNHGVEALTRATIAYLRRFSPGCHIILSTHFAKQDKEFSLPADEFIERNMRGKTNEEVYAPTLDCVLPESVCLHVGGDNYCYRNWQRWATIHYASLKRGAKSILWSCSIDPSAIDSEMLAALRTHHLITAREEITHRALLEHGLANVVGVSDIAFTLEPELVNFDLENFTAINLSPLVMRRNSAILSAFQVLLDYILNETDMSVALIPHVVQPADNDYDALNMLKFYDSARVRLVSDRLSAAQYKHIIGKARFCVAARTHVTIAAYSSFVPVLAIGYSTKSKGIASDLGMSDYLFDVEQIPKYDDIISVFNTLMDNETTVKEELMKQMPKYIEKAIPENGI